MKLNNIFTVMKKEFVRFFSDKRLLFTAVFMPGIMVYLIYTILGSAMNDANKIDEDYQYTIYGANVPDTIIPMMEANNLSVSICSDEDTDDLKNSLANKEADLVMIFPKEFDAAASYDVSSGVPAPNIELYYNSAKSESYEAYHTVSTLLNQYEASLANKFDINNDNNITYDCSSRKDSYGQKLSMLMPMLLMVFMFSGCMQIAPESIAGEKERGTIATILVTPVKRHQLAMGKVFALSCISFISGISSFIGIIASLPKIIGEQSGNIAGLLAVKDYAALLFTMLSTVLVIVSLMSILSAYAKTVKEATAYLTPLMLIIIGVSLSGLFIKSLDGAGSIIYAVPLLNSSQCFTNIFSFNYDAASIIITCVSNIIFSIVLTTVLSAMFNSEKIVFSK